MTEPIEPVVVAVEVRRGIEEAFKVFTAGIGAWWPVADHSVDPDRVEAVVLEAGIGGRLYERWHDGGQADWARVLAWEPPARLLLSWQPNPDRPAPTEVEVRFQAVEPDRTRVEVVHRGWERLGDQAPSPGRATRPAGRARWRRSRPAPGPAISGLTSSPASRSPRSTARTDRSTTAHATASRSAGGAPRTPSSRVARPMRNSL